MKTPETLTDADILRIGRTYRDGTASDEIARNLCIIALGLAGPGHKAESIAAARQMVCDAINRGRKV